MTKHSPESNARNQRPTHSGIIALVVAVSVTVLTLAWVVSTLAQQCQPTNFDNLSRFNNKPRDGNGNIHITVNYSAGTEGSNAIITRAMQSAIAEWNTYSSSTHVVLTRLLPASKRILTSITHSAPPLLEAVLISPPIRAGFITGRSLKQDYQLWVNLKSQLS